MFYKRPQHWVSISAANSAAVVFEEAARLSHQYGQRWTMASALTPKVPAQPDVSPPDAQTHRLSNG